jgi:hypothetical protein
MPLGQRATPGSGIPELPFGSLLADAGRNIRFFSVNPPGIITHKRITIKTDI